MANERRRRYNAYSGNTTDNPLLVGALTFNSAGLAALPTVASNEYLAITFGPLTTTPEIAWITAHNFGQTTATILRGRETSTPSQWPAGTRWAHGPTTWDFDYLRTPMSRVYARANYR
jgi:hypothetical protein